MIGGGCAGAAIVHHTHNVCAPWQYWNGGVCIAQASLPDDCSGLRQALAQQNQRGQAAQVEQESACSAGPSQDCSDKAYTAQGESSRYHALQEQYRMCQQRSVSSYPFGRHAVGNYSRRGLLFDPLEMGVDYQ